jgi:hypothetical protein
MKLWEKLAELEKKAAAEKGDFALFGLFLREDAEDRWDLIVSAPWIEVDKKNSMEYLAKEVVELLDPGEILQLSRIVPLDKSNPVLQAINHGVGVESGSMLKIENSVFGDVAIGKAYIMASDSSVWQENSK